MGASHHLMGEARARLGTEQPRLVRVLGDSSHIQDGPRCKIPLDFTAQTLVSWGRLMTDNLNLQDASTSDLEESQDSLWVPTPSTSAVPSFRNLTSLTPLVCDERAIQRLLETLLRRGGLSVNEAARRLGVTENSVRQYIRGRRQRPSLQWFIRLAEVCGARVTVEFPPKSGGG
jgi:hypothetical protein